MSTKRMGWLMLLCMGLTAVLQAQTTYGRLWKQVMQAEKKSLPATVLKLTDEIRRKARAEKNSSQQIKAAVWQMDQLRALTPDSIFPRLKQLEQWAETAEQATDRALLHSLVAESYACYTQRWELLFRTEIVGEEPADDMREWTAGMYIDKVCRHVHRALADSALLVATPSRQYAPLVIQGETSRYYGHDLYHLLTFRAIEALRQLEPLAEDISREAVNRLQREIAAVCERMITTYARSNSATGSLLLSLHYLGWQQSNRFVPIRWSSSGDFFTTGSYEAALEGLKTKYRHESACAEIFLLQAGLALAEQNRLDALQLCDEAIRLYPTYHRIAALKNLRQEILQPQLSISYSNQVLPDSRLEIQVSHCNTEGFKLQLYDAAGRLKDEQRYVLFPPADYKQRDTTCYYSVPEQVGGYTLRFSSALPEAAFSKQNAQRLHVTALKLLYARHTGREYEAVVLDARSGHPVADARVLLNKADWKGSQQELYTGADGSVRFNLPGEGAHIKAMKGADTAMVAQTIYSGFYGYRHTVQAEAEESEALMLLTDRSLYRPGQTVSLKGIAYKRCGDDTHVLAGRTYTVLLRDAGGQEVSRRTLQTNDFGSFATDFLLPAVCLNGMFSLQVEGVASTRFRVEEYKRPTFEVTFQDQTGSYRPGDEVVVRGGVQAYSGAPLAGQSVSYMVKRAVYQFWWPISDRQIASGQVTTEADGSFSFPLRLEEDSTRPNLDPVYYRYTIEATVTSPAGETQTSTHTVAAGQRSLVLQAELTPKSCRDSLLAVTFRVHNLNHLPVEAVGTYALYVTEGEEGKPTSDRPVVSGSFIANREMQMDWRHLPSGTYLLKASVLDKAGRESTVETRTVLYSLADRRPPVSAPLWLVEERNEFDTTQSASFRLGTTLKDAYVLMRVNSADGVVESRSLLLSDTIVRIDYPYLERYGEGVHVNFCVVKEDKVYLENLQLLKRQPQKQLEMKWEVFRDKLRPGQEEDWKLCVRTPEGTAADAEVLATMYDASLDKIWHRRQSFYIHYGRSVPHFSWTSSSGRGNGVFFERELKLQKVPSFSFDRVVRSIFGTYFFGLEDSYHVQSDRLVVVGYGSKASRAVVGSPRLLARNATPMAAEAAYAKNRVADMAEQSEEEGGGESLPQETDNLRTNFAETAFFYPQLRTDADGRLAFVFTMPQSLTRWSFRGYAHTRQMHLGTIEGSTVTEKEFMLTSNLPRFVRVGDRASVAASIANMTGREQQGTVILTLFDPHTERVIATQKRPFAVAAGQTVGVSFPFTVTDRHELLGCRLVADSREFSDGEQHLLPVLDNRERIIETLPMPIRGEQTRRFALDSLFNRHSRTATDRRLTIEFTGNPAWYAVQALPSLALPQHDDALSWATAYYANALASHIANSHPRLHTLFESWRLQGATQETLLSNLQKNQELKNILLAEAPWVLEAQTEAQRKERLATLFHLNNIRNNHATALLRLKDLQSGGAWAWYKGMAGSRYVTTYIALLNARLALLTGQQISGEAEELQQAALEYLHREELQNYRELREAEREGKKAAIGLSQSALQYLYLVALSGGQVPAANREAHRYYLSKVGELLQHGSVETKAVAAVVLHRAGRRAEAQEFVASLKEHLTRTDELGMFFAFHEQPYVWDGLRLQAHVRVLEALSLIGGNDEVVEEMKLWLLKQKQTQQWNSPVATADAVYALLMRGTDLLADQGDVRIVIGHEVLETVSPRKTTVPGLGYVKQTYTQPEVINARTVEVEKRNPGIAWGAVYAEYRTPMSDVQPHGGSLEMKKQLYVERMVNNALQLHPISARSVLRVGEKVVARLVIRTDRALDFVQLKDRHAACFEPLQSLSGYRWNGGTGCYTDVKDASTNFFFDNLGKGVYVLEHAFRVSRAGTYENGLATVQCAYAPEYAAHSASTSVTVAEAE